MLEVDVDVRELASDHRLQVADNAVDVSLGGGAAPVGGLGRKLDGDDAHVLLWFAVFVAFDAEVKPTKPVTSPQSLLPVLA
jgi:hypothetical protein